MQKCKSIILLFKIIKKKKTELLDEIAQWLQKLDLSVTKNCEVILDAAKAPVYRNAEELLNGQKMFIDIAKILFEYAGYFPVGLRPIIFQILQKIIARKDLDLSYLGFTNAEKKALFPEKFKNLEGSEKVEWSLLQRKFKRAEAYQSLLYSILEEILKMKNSQGLDKDEKAFTEKFLGLCYFRIPEFREKILSFLHEANSNETVKEWKENYWNIDSEDRSKVSIYYDWNSNFYEVLKETNTGKINNKILEDVLQYNDWIEKNGVVDTLFYHIIEEINNIIDKTFTSKDKIPWKEIPGYTILVKTFLIRMKAKKVQHWPDELRNASLTFMINSRLLNPFVSILYSKAYILDYQTVFKVYEQISEWITRLRRYRYNCPTNFDMNYFLLGMNMVVKSDQAACVAMCIRLVYYNYNFFPENIKLYFAEYFLRDLFFHFFLHWDYKVRYAFYNLLIYRFHYQHQTLMTDEKKPHHILKRLKLEEQDSKISKRELKNDYINLQLKLQIESIKEELEKYQNKKANKETRDTHYQFKDLHSMKTIGKSLPDLIDRKDSPTQNHIEIERIKGESPDEKKLRYNKAVFAQSDQNLDKDDLGDALKYIESGYKKFNKLFTEEYPGWVTKNQNMLKKTSGEQKEKIFNDPEVYTIDLRIAIDKEEEKDIVKTN